MRSILPIHLVAAGLLAALALNGCSCSGKEVEVPEPLPEEKVLSVQPAELSLAVGESATLQAFLDDEDVTALVEWTASDANVVELAGAVATARVTGEAKITANLEGRSADVALMVTDARLLSVEVSPENASTPVGRTATFTARGAFSDGQTRTLDVGVTWTSSTADVATIAPNGEATGVSVGAAQIFAHVGDLTSAPATLTVGAPIVAQVVVTPATASIPLGAQRTFVATATWSNGDVSDESAAASWSSTDEAIVAVSAGVATGMAPGGAGLTATVGGVTSNTAQVTVTAAVIASIALDPAQATVAEGQTQAFTATATFTDATTEDVSASATWSSSAPQVAQVTGGVALGVAQGTATITASLDGVTSSPATLTVDPAVITAIALSPTSAQVAEGATAAFTATATWSDGTATDISTTAAWLSSAPAVATVSGGVATGVAVGITELTASQGGVTSDPAELWVTPVSLVSISLAPRGGLLLVGDTLQLGATGHRSDGTTVDVTAVATWVSDDAAVATLAGGLVTAAGAGTALVTASTGGATSPPATVVVSTTPLQSVEVTPATASIPNGTAQAYVATGTFVDGATAVLTPIVDWTSSAPAIASVDLTGLATANAVGTSDITAQIAAVVSLPAALEVTAAEATSVVVTPASASIAKGRAQPFTATATFTDGTVATVNAQAAWSSDDPTVATLDTNGVATGAGQGVAAITATFGGVTSAPAQFTVTAPELDLLVAAPSTASIAKGQTQALTATGLYSDGSTQDFTAAAAWTSSAPLVASVSAPGQAFGAGVGTATLTAQHLGFTSNGVALTVTPAIIDSIALMPSTLSLAKGRTGALVATATWSDGTTTDVSATAQWASSDPAATVAGGAVTAVSEGTASVTATAGGVTSSPAGITVTPAVVDAVAIAPASASIAKGRTQAFTAQATWSDGAVTSVTATASFGTSDPLVATVSGSVATGAGQGSAGITATFNGVTSNVATLTVTPAVVDAIAVSPGSVSLAKGRTAPLVATATWSDATTSDITAVAGWASDAPAATVASGVVTAANVGSAQVTATHQGITSNPASVTVTPAEVDLVTVSPAAASVAKGRTQAFTATATYSDGTTQPVTGGASWTSGAPSVATIDASGLASTLAQGASAITATFAGVPSAPANLTVTPPVIDSLSLSPVNPSVAVGFSRQMTATAVWSDGAITDVTTLVGWSSAAPSIATIDAAGLATGASVGSASLTATAPGGAPSTSTQLTVSGATLTSVAVTPNTGRLPAGGVKLALRATGFFSNGSSMDLTASASWSSGNVPAAAVGDGPADKGVVTSGNPAVSSNVSITATVGARSGVAVVTVVPATLTSVGVSPTNASLPAGYALQYGASGAYSDGNNYDLTRTATWASTNTSAATVSNTSPDNGLAEGVGGGVTTVSATFGTQSGATQLTVTSASLVALSLTPASASRPVGLTLQYSVVGVFSDGVTVDLTTRAAWQSSNGSVASVSGAAGSEGLATVVGSGTTTITAAFGGFTANASLTGSTPALTGIVVTPVGATIGTSGFLQMTATATFSDGTTTDITQVATWTSSNATVATVRSDATFQGLVVGTGPGVTAIVATWGVFSGARNVTVSSATLSEMYITPAFPKIGVGTTVALRASGVWTDGSTADLTEVASWTTSAPAVATVSNATGSRGLATGVGGGTTSVTATYGAVSDATTVTVTASPMVALLVTPANRSVPLGTQVQYTATAQYADGTLQNLTGQVGWLTSDAAVASISNTAGSRGLATAVGGGLATITAQFGALSGGASLEVRNVALTSLSISPANAQLPIGYIRSFTVTATFSDGSTEDLTAQAGWTTGDQAIAVAGSAPGTFGIVTGVGEGSTTVSATVFGQSANTVVQVLNWLLCGIVVTPADQTIAVGQSLQMVATGTFGPACPPTAPNVLSLDVTKQTTWRVVPKQRVSVSNSPGSEGLATAVSTGSPNFGNVRAERTVNGIVVNGSAKVFTSP